MYLFDLTKQFIKKYYPAQHLVSAGLLSSLFVILLVMYAVSSSENPQGQAALVELSPASQSPKLNLETPDTAQEQSMDVVDAIAVSEPSVIEEPAVLIEQPPEVTKPNYWQHIEVRAGDNLTAIFAQVGLSNSDLFHVLNSNDEADVLNKLFPGYQLSFLIPPPGNLEQLEVLKSPIDGYLFTLVDGYYEVETISKTPEVRQVFKHGVITDSLFMAGQKEEIAALTIMEMANIFGGVVDFILDPRLGDNFSILYEEEYLDGEFIGTGDILAAQFTNQNKQYIAVQYEDTEGEPGYYNPDGESMRKAFLRAPIDVFRISSNFSLARRHPILNTIRAHKGTDYAAPRGTPIRATSDGRVTWAARNGSFGKLVVVKHDGAFETKYAHLSDYANGVKKGRRVRQGDIIGYVGSTGSATGPHLHYEFLVDGVHKNPRTILEQLPKAKSVPEEELQRFYNQTSPLMTKFKSLEENRMIIIRQQSAE